MRRSRKKGQFLRTHSCRDKSQSTDERFFTFARFCENYAERIGHERMTQNSSSPSFGPS